MNLQVFKMLMTNNRWLRDPKLKEANIKQMYNQRLHIKFEKADNESDFDYFRKCKKKGWLPYLIAHRNGTIGTFTYPFFDSWLRNADPTLYKTLFQPAETDTCVIDEGVLYDESMECMKKSKEGEEYVEDINGYKVSMDGVRLLAERQDITVETMIDIIKKSDANYDADRPCL